MRRTVRYGMPVMGDMEGLAMSRLNHSLRQMFHGIAFDKAEGDEGEDKGGGGAGGSGDAGKGKGKPPSVEELQAELEKTREALKNANHESADRRKRLEALEIDEAKRKQEEQAKKDAELSEAQRLQKRIAEVEALAQQKDAALKAHQLDAAIKDAARTLKFRDPADALKMIDRAKVTIGDDGTVSGADDQLKELAKAKPYLVESESVVKPPKGTPTPKVNKPQGGGSDEKPAVKPLVKF